MGLTPYNKENFLAGKNLPHYFEVRFKNHPNGLEKVHCGTLKDVEKTLEIHPDATVTQIFPPIPDTVNVQATDLGTEQALKEAVPALPESELEPLDLKDLFS